MSDMEKIMNVLVWFQIEGQAQKCLWTYGDDSEEFAEKIDNEKAWSDLFTEVPVKAGFFDIPKWDDSRNRGGIATKFRWKLPRLYR